MKKNLFYYLFTVICSVTLFASCSDDDEKVVNPVPQTTFTGENGLQLTYNGAPMLGKKVILLLPMQPMLRRQLYVWKGNLT